ncbi:acetylglutamate kinase, partial [Microbacteriaceae bacterium K1510]|nr:acetylglutamate kinase [Microbacteriaceae bacterium K1510]
HFVDGLRVTCQDTMDVVEMVLAGSINKQLVRKLFRAGAKAWGASGVDGGTLIARQTEKPLGLVGEIQAVNPSMMTSMLECGYLPVLAPLGVSSDGEQVYNLNADTAAGAIAAALGAEQLLMITDVPGIMQTSPSGEKKLLEETDPLEVEAMIRSGTIYGGMIPKVTAALDALQQGVAKVVICQGSAADLLDASAGRQVGTSIVPIKKGVVES